MEVLGPITIFRSAVVAGRKQDSDRSWDLAAGESPSPPPLAAPVLISGRSRVTTSIVEADPDEVADDVLENPRG